MIYTAIPESKEDIPKDREIDGHTERNEKWKWLQMQRSV